MRKIISIIFCILLVFSFTACDTKKTDPVDPGNTKPSFSRPTSAQEQAHYDAMLLDEAKQVKPFTITSVAVLTKGNIARYGKYELEFNLSASFTSKESHNFNIVDIRADITTPNGKKESQACFYKRDTAPQWALRYSPREVGEYTFTINDYKSEYKTQEMSFNSVASDSRGFLSVNDAKMVDSNNDMVLLYGMNYAWAPIQEYKENIPKVAESGMNFIRFWGQCPWSPYNLERMPKYVDGVKLEGEVQNDSVVEYKGLGDYSITNAERLDDLITLFEEYDIYMQYCIFNLWDFSSNHWKTNPYNIDNGGMCVWRTNDTNYWTHPSAKRYQKQLMRYLYARYSYSTSFGVFEFWNEADNKIAPDSPEIGAAWHKEMSDYIDTIDVRKVPKTTSYAWIDHADLGGQTPWRELDFLDIYNGHRYGKVGRDSLPIWTEQLSDLKKWQGETVTRPVYLGEHSEDGAEGRDGGILRDRFYLDALYSSVLIGGAAVTSMHWRVDNSFMLSENMLEYTKSMKTILSPLERQIDNSVHKDLGIANEMTAGGYFDSDFALIYIRDNAPEGALAPYMSNVPRVLNGKTLSGLNLDAGTYVATFYNTITGAVIQTKDYTGGELALCEFSRDVVVKIAAQ